MVLGMDATTHTVPTQPTPDRTAAARAMRKRKAEERWAERLAERGWQCISPYGADGPPALTLPLITPGSSEGEWTDDAGNRYRMLDINGYRGFVPA